MSSDIIVPRATIYRARMQLEQAEAIIIGLSAAYERISALFKRAPAAKDEQAMTIRRAWLRASA